MTAAATPPTANMDHRRNRSRRTNYSSSSSTVRYYLRQFGLCVGSISAAASLVWLAILLYVLTKTDTALLPRRCLEASLGLLSFASSLSLVYGVFAESRTWISVWTVGSLSVLVSSWSAFCYRKYAVAGPEDLGATRTWLWVITVLYVMASLPLVKLYRQLESEDGLLKCKWRSDPDGCYKAEKHYCVATRPPNKEEDLHNPV